jgi:beta-glucanase (GH16 family)
MRAVVKHRIVKVGLIVVVAISLGTFVTMRLSHAGTNLNIEAESGTPSSAASIVSDTTASAGNAVKFGQAVSGGSNPDPVGQSAGVWTMKFNDEFNVSSVTTVDAPNGLVRFGSGPTWKAWYPNATVGDGNAHSNNPGAELEYYDISGLSADGNNAILTATHNNAHSGYAYTSGMLQSNPTFNPLYGYTEARIKAPGAGGSWPAFWIISSAYDWPPEVDIFENFGDANSYKASNFGPSSSVFGNVINTSVTNWHVYGLLWKANKLTWYLDGTQVANETVVGSIPTEPMYLVLDLAVNNTNNNTFSTQVDYVRYWQ